MTQGRTASRGFVTIATGREEYYILAQNLLRSYHFHSRSPMPFAIICDRENEYTSGFDTVIVMDHPLCTAFDKLRLLDLAPYAETIFIEADCLAYRDLNGLWEVFKDGPDFGSLGVVLPLDSELGWIEPEFLGPYQDRFQEQYLHQGGVYYLRKDRLEAFMQTCRDICLHRAEFHFRIPTEEPVFALACMLHGFKPPKDWIDVFCFYPVATILRMDINKGILSFALPYRPVSPPGIFLVHWGTANTRKSLYKREAAVVYQNRNRKFARFLIEVKYRFQTFLYQFPDFLKSHIPVPVKEHLYRLRHKIK